MLRKVLYLLVSCATRRVRNVRELHSANEMAHHVRGVSGGGMGVALGGSVLAATVPPGFTETIISGPSTNAVGVAFEANGRMYVWEGTGQVWFKDTGRR